MHYPLQNSLLSQSAVLDGVTASWGEVAKDAHYEEAVLAWCWGDFHPFGCEDSGALVSY